MIFFKPQNWHRQVLFYKVIGLTINNQKFKIGSALASMHLILLKTVLAHSPKSSRQNDTRKLKKYLLGPKRRTSKDQNPNLITAAENLKI